MRAAGVLARGPLAAPAALLCLGAAVATAAIAGPTELVSQGPGGTAPVTSRDLGAISADGRFVALSSAGRDLDPTNTNPYADVYLKDRASGTFERVSKPTGGGSANGASSIGRGGMSTDAGIVAFTSTATNLDANDVNGVSDVFVRDRSAGTTTQVSDAVGGFDANGRSYDAAVGGDGRYVAFTTEATNLVAADANGKADVVVHDRQAGTTSLVSATPSGLAGDGASGSPVVSGDGTKVAFVSSAGDLVAGDTNGRADVFVRDLATGTTERVSVANSGAEANSDSSEPFLSHDGAIVGFTTLATNLGGVKDRVGFDVYLRLGGPDRLERVMTAPGIEAGGAMLEGWISADGRHVAFASSFSGFTAGDGTEVDVFHLDRVTREITHLSRSHDGRRANGQQRLPAIAAGGGAVVYRSDATNLVPNMLNAFGTQVYLRPLSHDAVAADLDGDGVGNLVDTCPAEADPGQGDVDGDGRGDACDPDIDADRLRNPVEPLQDTSPAQRDSDGDGYDDFVDDYPADASRLLGTEHQTVNDSDLGSEDGALQVKLSYDSTSKKFKYLAAGTLRPNTTYTIAVHRRAEGIRDQKVCAAKTNATGAFACQGEVRLTFFTHLRLLRGATTVVAVEPDRPLGG